MQQVAFYNPNTSVWSVISNVNTTYSTFDELLSAHPHTLVFNTSDATLYLNNAPTTPYGIQRLCANSTSYVGQFLEGAPEIDVAEMHNVRRYIVNVDGIEWDQVLELMEGFTVGDMFSSPFMLEPVAFIGFWSREASDTHLCNNAHFEIGDDQKAACIMYLQMLYSDYLSDDCFEVDYYDPEWAQARGIELVEDALNILPV